MSLTLFSPGYLNFCPAKSASPKHVPALSHFIVLFITCIIVHFPQFKPTNALNHHVIHNHTHYFELNGNYMHLFAEIVESSP